MPVGTRSSDQGSIGDVIWGNEIGVVQANGVGISVSSSNNVIGGTAFPTLRVGHDALADSGNIVQGNTTAGIMLSGPAGTGNLVDGNEVLDNQGDGILVETSNNLIGESAGNLISGNSDRRPHRRCHVGGEPFSPRRGTSSRRT